jgi:hypothetical protein
MASTAHKIQKKVRESIEEGDVAGVVDQGKELFEEAGKWLEKNNSSLLNIAILTLSVGMFSYLLTRGRRFILIL